MVVINQLISRGPHLVPSARTQALKPASNELGRSPRPGWNHSYY